MNKFRKTVLRGYLLDDSVTLTLEEFSSACTVQSARIIELVEEGILEPKIARPSPWLFSAVDLKRASKAIRLQRDLEINLAGVALILDLLEEVEGLRARIGNLEND